MILGFLGFLGFLEILENKDRYKIKRSFGYVVIGLGFL
jgi:hypothetical protein